jgi:hypothetical protein
MKLSRLLFGARHAADTEAHDTAAKALAEKRAAYSWQAYQTLFSFNGQQYQTSPFGPMSAEPLLGACGPAYAVLDRRASIMGEARPVFQRLERGKPTDIYSSRELELLKMPWQGGSFRQLAAICESDVASAGNSYWIRIGQELARLDPDWVTIITAPITIEGRDVGERLVGYGVQRPSHQPIYLTPAEVAHYKPSAPIGSPFRGESWLASVASDASSDVEMTRYKGNYLKNGAMPSLAVMYEPSIDMEQIEQFVPLFNSKFVGPMNAGKVMHLMGGRDVKTVGATLDELAFKAVQGAGETRIAAAAGVPASVAGFSEGMQGSSLNAGNYTATRRLFGDAKIRPLLGSFCDAFATLLTVPADSRLWYDDSGVSFFQEDVADEAQIRQLNAQTIKTLVDGGFTPETAVSAATTGDFSALKHSGLYSVQLQPPTDGTTPSTIEGPADEQPPD